MLLRGECRHACDGDGRTDSPLAALIELVPRCHHAGRIAQASPRRVLDGAALPTAAVAATAVCRAAAGLAQRAAHLSAVMLKAGSVTILFFPVTACLDLVK